MTLSTSKISVDIIKYECYFPVFNMIHSKYVFKDAYIQKYIVIFNDKSEISTAFMDKQRTNVAPTSKFSAFFIV